MEFSSDSSSGAEGPLRCAIWVQNIRSKEDSWRKAGVVAAVEVVLEWMVPEPMLEALAEVTLASLRSLV